jgi:hypothetical protein
MPRDPTPLTELAERNQAMSATETVGAMRSAMIVGQTLVALRSLRGEPWDVPTPVGLLSWCPRQKWHSDLAASEVTRSSRGG